RLVETGERPKLVLPVGIRQRPQVEHEIRVRWEAVLVAEGLDEDGQHVLLARPYAAPDDLGELVDAGARRVDDEVGGVDDLAQKLALVRDGGPERGAVPVEGVAPPGLAVALEENLVAGLQEQQ